MTHPIHIALPVPPLGHSLGEAGDAYVASLVVRIVAGDQTFDLGGETFEALVSAARLRHLAFHPRTRALVSGEIKGPSLGSAIERNWSAIDSSASDMPSLREIAEIISKASTASATVAWFQAN